MGDKKFEIKEELKLEEAVERLQKLVDELKKGKLTLAADEETYLVEPPAEIELELEFKGKKGKEELEIELSWKLPGYTGEEDEDEEKEEGEESKPAESAKALVTEPCSCASCSPGSAPGHHGHPMKKLMPLLALGFAAATVAVAAKNGLPQWAVDLKDKALKLLGRAPEIEEVLVVEEPSRLPEWILVRRDKLPSWAVDRGEEGLRRVAELKEKKLRR